MTLRYETSAVSFSVASALLASLKVNLRRVLAFGYRRGGWKACNWWRNFSAYAHVNMSDVGLYVSVYLLGVTMRLQAVAHSSVSLNCCVHKKMCREFAQLS